MNHPDPSAAAAIAAAWALAFLPPSHRASPTMVFLVVLAMVILVLWLYRRRK